MTGLGLTLVAFSLLDPTYFVGRDVYADVSAFLAMAGPTRAALAFEGVGVDGRPCRLRVRKTARQIHFDPELGGDHAFVVPNRRDEAILGGFEGQSLWISAFVDADPDGAAVRGQFGVRTSLALLRSKGGNVVAYDYERVDQQDLAYTVLGRVTCRSMMRSR